MIERLVLLSENRSLRFFLVGILFLAVQTTIVNDMRPFGVSLELMLLVAVSAGLAGGQATGIVGGFAAGLLYDMVLTTPLGLCAGVFGIVGYLAGYVHAFVHRPTWWSRLAMGATASFVGVVLVPLAATITGSEGVLTSRVPFIGLVVAVSNTVLCLPAERVCRWALVPRQAVV